MDCKEFREVLDLYVDGELSPEAGGAARAHLKDCAACGRAEAQLLHLRRALRRVVSGHQPPPELANDVRRALGLRRRSMRRASPPFWRLKVSLPAPVFALLVAAVVGFGGWAALARRPELPPGGKGAGRRVSPAATAPSTDARGEFDFSRFDRGERASIHVVRREGPDGAGR